ncbi:MAG: hypothetical protein OEZ36_11710, partial [Spirochaetota bacterium]|nr:hypothetical protein [Spirochaetota bacterium]
MISQEKIHTKRFFKRFLIIFISLLAILFTVIYITNLYSSKSELEIYKYNQNIQVSKKLDKIRSKLDTVISDINILVKYHDMINYIEKKDSVSKLYLTDLIYKIMTNKQYINQIRLLSNDGKEIIKIIRKNNTVISIDKENLQDKSHRSYFKNSLPLKINEMYITRLELNKEHNKIEIPYNPVIRFIVPVYSFDKKRYGFLVFNYSAKSLMEDTGIKQKHDINNNFMSDKEGYWLEGVDEKDKWGFILDSAKNKNIKLSNPPLWTKIQANKNGQFILSDGLYTFTKFTPKV